MICEVGVQVECVARLVLDLRLVWCNACLQQCCRCRLEEGRLWARRMLRCHCPFCVISNSIGGDCSFLRSMNWLHLGYYTIDECIAFVLHSSLGCSHDARSQQVLSCAGMHWRMLRDDRLIDYRSGRSGDWLNHVCNHGMAPFLSSSGFADPILLWLRMLLWLIQSTIVTWLTRVWGIVSIAMFKLLSQFSDSLPFAAVVVDLWQAPRWCSVLQLSEQWRSQVLPTVTCGVTCMAMMDLVIHSIDVDHVVSGSWICCMEY